MFLKKNDSIVKKNESIFDEKTYRLWIIYYYYII